MGDEGIEYVCVLWPLEAWRAARGSASPRNAMPTTATAADLAGSTLLAALLPEELKTVAPLFALRRFPKSAILVTEGDRLDLFSIVLTGRVKFFWRDDAGRQVDVAIVGPGEGVAAEASG